jgi:hypothetical protein
MFKRAPKDQSIAQTRMHARTVRDHQIRDHRRRWILCSANHRKVSATAHKLLKEGRSGGIP